ncbi:MAG: MTH938/NDUFAF3 family protein [Dehalococcoidia bacterium]
MVRIESLSFGSITVGGKRYRRDVILLPDGTVKQRKGGFWIFGSHSFKKNEIEELSRAGAEEIMIRTGTNSKAGLSNEAKSYVGQAQLQLYTLPSHEAVPEFNHLVDLGKKVAAIIHITC